MTDNSQLLSGAERKARNLEAVLRVSEAIGSTLDLGQTLSATCEVAVDLLRVSHSSLVLISPGGVSGEVLAEHPEIGTRGLVIPIPGTPDAADRLTEPVFIEDVRDWLDAGSLRDILLEHKIRSLLIVPVVSRGAVLGYFSLDTVGFAHQYDAEEIELCKIFASQAGAAIRNAQLHEETKQRVEQLEALRRTSLAITSMQNDEGLLGEIVGQAVGLLRAKSGGIYEYRPERRELTVIVDSHRPDRVGITLGLGQGAAGRIVRDNASYMIVHDYNNWEGRAPQYAEKRPYGSVVEVPLRWRGKVVGVLYVEDEVGREFTAEDARLLGLFADHAAIALNNSELLLAHTKLLHELSVQQNRHLRRLSSAAAQALSGDLNRISFLKTLAKEAVSFMDGDSATLWPYDRVRGRFVRKELVTYGIPAEELELFRRIAPKPGGITYKVVSDGWLPVPDVDADRDFLKCSERTALLKRIGVKSFMGVTLKVAGETAGVLYVNYNRRRGFDKEDRRRMEALAANAALALGIVRAAQDFEERDRRLSAEQTLTELAKLLLGTVERQEMLRAAVRHARHALGTDRCSIVLPEPDGRLHVVAEDADPKIMTREIEVERGARSQTGYTIDKGKPVRVYDYDEEKDFAPSKFVTEWGIKSGMSVPMLRGAEVVGAMLVHSLERREFTQAEEGLLLAIANQTAIALKTAEQYDEIVRKSAYLEALYEASKEITRSGFDRQHVLETIVEQAVRCLVDSSGQSKATLGTIQTYDHETDYLEFVAAYPAKVLPKLRKQLGHRRRITDVSKNLMGLAGLTVKRREALRVADVTEGYAAEYYYMFRDETRSELTAPMVYGDEVIGVISVESDRRDAFNEQDEKELCAMADFAAIAIHNASQYQELKSTEQLVEARTAVAWMGMASGVWGHSVRGHAVNIRGLVRSLRNSLRSVITLPGTRRKIAEMLDRVEGLVSQILEKPLVKPLGPDHADSKVPVNDLLRERLKQLQKEEPYRSLRVDKDFRAGDDVTVRCDPEWLRRALDILLDNAARAMSRVEPGRRSLTVGTALKGDNVEITVRDTGPGIPAELRDRILNDKVKGEGAGVGLLMARAIVQAYDGDIALGETGPHGTMMCITLKSGRMAQRARPPAAPARHRFLLVGRPDDPWGKKILQGVAARLSAEVAVRAEHEALELKSASNYDVAVVDNSVVGDGAGVVSHLLALRRDLPVVVVSASPLQEETRAVMQAGATDCVTKSDDEEALLETFRRELSRARA